MSEPDVEPELLERECKCGALYYLRMDAGGEEGVTVQVACKHQEVGKRFIFWATVWKGLLPGMIDKS